LQPPCRRCLEVVFLNFSSRQKNYKQYPSTPPSDLLTGMEVRASDMQQCPKHLSRCVTSPCPRVSGVSIPRHLTHWKEQPGEESETQSQRRHGSGEKLQNRKRGNTQCERIRVDVLLMPAGVLFAGFCRAPVPAAAATPLQLLHPPSGRSCRSPSGS
jgi:hypothetical protein